MRIERTKNAMRNGIWGVIGRFVGLLLPFLSRTAIIKILGAEYLGLNGLFTSILTVLNLTELGVGTAIVYSMYKPIADGDDELVCALLNLYRKIYKIIGIVIICIGGILTPFLNHLISGDIPQDINLYILYGLYILNTALSYLLYAYKKSLIHACQRDDITSKITIMIDVLLNGLQIFVLYATHNYYWFVILQIVMTIASNLINSYYAKKIFPQYFCSGEISKEMGADIRQRVTGLVVIKVAQVSRNALDSIIVSYFLGLQIVAMYNNYYYIISAVGSVLLVFMNAIAAGVGNSVAIDSKSKNLSDMRNINYIYMLLSGICAACIITMYQPFMEIWVGKELMFPNSVMILFSLYFVLTKVGDVQAQYFDAVGLWWNGRWRGIIEAVANLFLNIMLGYFFGVFGIVIATILTVAFINFPLSTYYTFKYYFRNGMKSFILEQLFIMMSILFACAICYLVTYNLEFGGSIISKLFCLVCRGMVSVGIFLIVFSLINIFNNQFRESVVWIRNKILRK